MNEPKKYWYKVEVMPLDEVLLYIGCTSMGEKDLLAALSANQYLYLEDLVYVGEDDTVRSWTEWDPNCQSRVYLNPRYLVSLLPLAGDPRLQGRGTQESNLLRLPSTRPPIGN